MKVKSEEKEVKDDTPAVKLPKIPKIKAEPSSIKTEVKKEVNTSCTVCPRDSYPFYTEMYYKKMGQDFLGHIVLLILDKNSKIRCARINLYYLICLRHLFRSSAVRNLNIFPSLKILFFPSCVRYIF